MQRVKSIALMAMMVLSLWSCAPEEVDSPSVPRSQTEAQQLLQELKSSWSYSPTSLRSLSEIRQIPDSLMLLFASVSPRWDQAQYYRGKRQEHLIHIPLDAQHSVRLLSSELDSTLRKSYTDRDLSRTSLLSITRDQGQRNYFLHLIPNLSYLEAGGELPDSVLIPKGFSGSVMLFDMNHQLVQTGLLEQGEKADQLRGWIRICYRQEITAYVGTDSGQLENGRFYRQVCYDVPMNIDRDHGGPGDSDSFLDYDYGGFYPGGGGGGVSKFARFGMIREFLPLGINTTLREEGLASLDSVLKILSLDCGYKALMKAVRDMKGIASVTDTTVRTNGSLVSFNPQGKELRIKKGESQAYNHHSIIHEMIHAYQVGMCKQLGITYKNSMQGMIEFEDQLIRDLYNYRQLASKQKKYDPNIDADRDTLRTLFSENYKSYNKSYSGGGMGVNKLITDALVDYIEWIDRLTQGGTMMPTHIDEGEYWRRAKNFPIMHNSYQDRFDSKGRPIYIYDKSSGYDRRILNNYLNQVRSNNCK